MARKKTELGPTPEQMAERERFERRRAWFQMEWQRQEANRYQMAVDEDYYDSLQWTEDEAREVRGRGQNPIVYNEVAPTIDWLIGTERRMRRDFKVLARNVKSDEATNDAEIKTQLLKYLDDVCRAPFERSQAASEAWKGGLGWIETGITSDPEKEMIYCGAESWRHMLYDSMGLKLDTSDWRFQFRFKEVDLDIAAAYFPGKEDLLLKASNVGMETDADAGWTGLFPSMGLVGRWNMPAKYTQFDPDVWLSNHRKRVLLIECWNFEPTREKVEGGTGMATRLQMHVSIMTKLDTLLEMPSPYRHNRFPFIPVWAYRRSRDRAPYSPIRRVRGPQDGLNKRMSKALFEASSNQLLAEKGAIDQDEMDLEEIRDELNSPDGIAVFNDGALSGNKIKPVERKGDAQAQLTLAEVDRAAIGRGSGISMEQRGAQSNVVAAKGIIAKHEQGAMLTAELFDNLLLAHQMEGEIKIALMEQFYTEEKTFSVTGERFKLDYFTINARQPDGRVLNDITRHKAQFVIGDAPWRQALAEAAFEQAMDMLGHLAPAAPQVVTAILDLIFEWSDLPNKQTIIQRIRSVTGQSDPDKGDTPEQQATKAKQAALAQAQFNAEMAMLQAQVQEAKAKGLKLNTEALAKKLEAIYIAAQAAQVALQVPGAMPVADQLLESSGFVDESGQGTGAVVPNTPVATGPGAPALPSPGGAPMNDPRQADGEMNGIETPAADGVVA